MRKQIIYILVLLALLNNCSCISQLKKLKINSYINNFQKTNNISGIAFGLVEGKSISWMQGYGYADIENKIEVDPTKTLFRWASMSKMLCSIIALRLHQMGLINIDQEISNYLPDYKTPTNYTINCEGKPTVQHASVVFNCTNNFAYVPIPFVERSMTIRMLLAHAGGIMDYVNGNTNPVPPDSQLNDPKINTGIQWALRYFANNPVIAIPGSQYNYTTFGFNLAGAAIEAATGMRYEDLARAIIFQNAGGMPSMVPDKEWLGIFRPNRAKGYLDGKKPSHENDVSYKLPGGGFMSTLQDLANFAISLRGNDVMSISMKQVAWSPRNPSVTQYYGLGFAISYNGSNPYCYGHSGAQDKTRTELRYYPNDDMSLVVMSNSQNFLSSTFLKGIENIILNENESSNNIGFLPIK